MLLSLLSLDTSMPNEIEISSTQCRLGHYVYVCINLHHIIIQFTSCTHRLHDVFLQSACSFVSASALIVIKRSRIHVPRVRALFMPPKYPGEDLYMLGKV